MLDFKWISKERRKIELLSDEAEKAKRHEYLDEVIDKIHDYNRIIYDYQYAQKRKEILDRGVIFTPCLQSSAIKANWSKLFASLLSTTEKRKIFYDSFRWHIFSYEKVIAKTKTSARQAFNRCKKDNVYVFYQHREEAYHIENPQYLKSSDFDSEQDIYIYDMINRWTYVHTHESQCGPYFYKL